MDESSPGFSISPEVAVGEECRRILLAETAGAIDALEGFGADPDHAVHETRRHGKRIRALLLLARPIAGGGGAIARANRLVRDAARRLAPARDSLVLAQTLSAILASKGAPRCGETGKTELRRLRRHHRRILDGPDLLARAETAAVEFREASGIFRRWDWARVKPSAVVAAVVANYRAGAELFETSRLTRDPHDCHDWRKRTKYFLFHCRLLSRVVPDPLAELADLAEALGSSLGEHHDIAVLEDALLDGNATDRIGHEVLALIGLCEHRRAELEKTFFASGELVYAEPPEKLSRRLGETFGKKI